MKQIKFRAWDKKQKKMIYDFYVYSKGGVINITTDKCPSCGLQMDFPLPLTDIILMQYTGLKDKNGKEIYEGDIVKDAEYGEGNEKYYVVKFDEYRGGFYPFAKGDGCGCCEKDVIYPIFEFLLKDKKDIADCEIIGNIYENPELIEKLKQENKNE